MVESLISESGKQKLENPTINQNQNVEEELHTENKLEISINSNPKDNNSSQIKDG